MRGIPERREMQKQKGKGRVGSRESSGNQIFWNLGLNITLCVWSLKLREAGERK